MVKRTSTGNLGAHSQCERKDHKVIKTTKCPQFVAKAVGWKRQDLVAAHGYTLCENGGLVKEVNGEKLTSIDFDGELESIKFIIPVDDIAKQIFKNSKGKIGPTQREKIRNLALTNFWMSCLIKTPSTLVSQVFKQLPPTLAKTYPELAISKLHRRKAAGTDIVHGDVGAKQRIDGDRTAANLLKTKVGLRFTVRYRVATVIWM
jgi:hypothetical protein